MFFETTGLLMIHISKHFHWVVGFGVLLLSPPQVTRYLHRFVEYAFLRDTSDNGCLLGTDRLNIVDAIQHVFSDRELLNHTSVVLIHCDDTKNSTKMEEFILSTRDYLWGYPLPECPTCGPVNVSAKLIGEFAQVECSGCGMSTEGKGVKRPDSFWSVKSGELKNSKYFWKPFNSTTPWAKHGWK
jgi:hypothetical protein